MADYPIVQLVTLWFVVAIFLQVESSGSGPFVRMIGLVARVLLYLLPFIILALVFDRLDDERYWHEYVIAISTSVRTAFAPLLAVVVSLNQRVQQFDREVLVQRIVRIPAVG